MVSEPHSSNEQGSSMATPASSSSSSNKSPSPSSNLSLLIANLTAFVSEKLGASNFIIWKNQWQNILKATGLNSFVDGTGVTPPAKIRNSSNEEVTNPEFLQWLVDDAHLMSCIFGTLSSAIYSVVLNCNTSREAWTSIEKRFTTLSRSHVHQLKNRLNSTTKNTSTMEVYLQQIKNLSDQLTLVGATVDNEDLVLITLNGLYDEFRAFKTSIRTRPFPITMEELCSLLLSEAIHEDSSLKSSQSSPDLTVAFATSRGGYQGNSTFSRSYYPQNRGFRGSSRGFRGNSRGYSSNRGGYRGGGRSHSNSGGNTSQVHHTPTPHHTPGSQHQFSGIVCQICDKPGHTAVTCWHRLNIDYQPQAYSGSYPSQPQNKAFVTTVPEQSTSNWYVDSAASTHITNDLSNLSIYEPYSGPEQVTVGNGSTLPIQNTGTGQGSQASTFSGPAY